jgi:hypothetical protein
MPFFERHLVLAHSPFEATPPHVPGGRGSYDVPRNLPLAMSPIWKGTNAQMLAPVRESLAKNQPMAWERVHRLPGYVYFDHSVHVAKGVGCTTCHGDVGGMRLMRQAAPLTMQWCLDCHRAPERYLRPREAVFDPTWQTPKNQAEVGPKLAAGYHINTGHLTDCTICHR